MVASQKGEMEAARRPGGDVVMGVCGRHVERTWWENSRLMSLILLFFFIIYILS